jgi:hypothetical protein
MLMKEISFNYEKRRKMLLVEVTSPYGGIHI